MLRSIILIILIAVLLAPLYIPSYYLGLLIWIGILALGALGLELLMGYAGQLSLGHGGFVAVSAYVTAILHHAGVHPILTLIVAVLATVMVSYVIGLPILKLEGFYLAIATLTFGLLVHGLAVAMLNVTGGSSGMGVSPLTFFGISFSKSYQFYYLVLFFLIPLFLMGRNIVKSRFGRSYVAIQSNEDAAKALGIQVSQRKMQAFMISGGYAAVCGYLMTFYLQFVAPDVFGMFLSVDFIIISMLGGHGFIYSPLIGSFVWVLLKELLQSIGDLKILATGLVLALIILFFPKGIFGFLKKLQSIKFSNKMD